MARTMDLSFLRSIKQQQQQHTPTSSITFSFFSSLNNNNNPSTSSVLTHHDDDDDRVCLHFSLGHTSCSSCHHQQQLITDNKPLTLNNNNNNNKPRIIIKQKHKPTTMFFSSLFFSLKNDNNNNNPSSSVLDVTHDDDRVCLHFSLGHPSCPTCCHHHQQQQLITNKKRKRSQKQLTLKNKKPRINNWVWDDHHHHPVGGRPRNWGCSTAMVLYDDPWKIKKLLTQSDLGNNCNILIKRELANDFIVPVLGGRHICENRDVPVRVWDSDTDSFHSLVFAIRRSNNSHVFKDTWVKDFVIRRNLQVGNEIGLIWDKYNQHFIFSVLGRF